MGRFFLNFTLCVFIVIVPLTWGYLQEILFHESEREDGNYYAFRSHISDIFKYPINNVRRVCWRGWWNFYSQENFQGFVVGRGSRAEMICVSETFRYRSFRFVGDRDTKVDALSLYVGYSNEGDELYVQKSAYAGITTPIRSLGYTGKSAWTLFEWTNFEGKSYCLPPPPTKFGYDESGNVTRDFGIVTVGSILKGCHKVSVEEEERQRIRTSQNSILQHLQQLF